MDHGATVLLGLPHHRVAHDVKHPEVGDAGQDVQHFWLIEVVVGQVQHRQLLHQEID